MPHACQRAVGIGAAHAYASHQRDRPAPPRRARALLRARGRFLLRRHRLRVGHRLPTPCAAGGPARRPRQAVILLLPEALQANLEPQVRVAVERYCRTKILESKATLSSTLWVGLKALQIGIFFLACCLASAGVISQSGLSAVFRANIASERLAIIGWVSLWRPVETCLYEWWSLWREVRLYDYIRGMDIVTPISRDR